MNESLQQGDYSITLTQDTPEGQEQIQLPIVPDEISVKFDVDNLRYNVLAMGEVVRPGSRKLKNLQLKSYFPASLRPDEYAAKIEKMIENMLPVRITLVRTDLDKAFWDLNMEVLIESFEKSEAGGEVGDINYSLSLVEYRQHKAVIIGV